jgi:hypothetical protein
MQGDKIAVVPEYTYSSTYEYPISIIDAILHQILTEKRKLCKASIDKISAKIKGHNGIKDKLTILRQSIHPPTS